MKVDTSNWKSFKIVDLFTKIETCKCGDAGSLEEGNDINYIGAKWKDNGVMQRVAREESLVTKGNAVVFICSGDGSAGYAIYQDKDFIGSTTLKAGYLENIMTPQIGLFLATVLCLERPKYGYGRKWLSERFENTTIKLPTTSDGNPDWEYMEEFMGGLHSEPITTSVKHSKIPLETEKWAEFRFEELIDSIEKASAHTKEDVEETTHFDKNAIPYVSRTENNNSVDFFCVNDNLDGIEEENALVIGDTTSTISYQKEPFIAGDHIVVIRADWLNLYTGLFIVSLLQKERYRYSYGRSFKIDNIKNTKLKLPIKEDKTPDWEWMENYIKSLPYSDRI